MAESAAITRLWRLSKASVTWTSDSSEAISSLPPTSSSSTAQVGGSRLAHWLVASIRIRPARGGRANRQDDEIGFPRLGLPGRPPIIPRRLAQTAPFALIIVLAIYPG